MFNRGKLALALEAYRKDFHTKAAYRNNKTHWEDEQYKWIAVKHFQDNWDIDAADFSAMLRRSIELHDNLMDTDWVYAGDRIREMAELAPETVRQMFRDLYDESKSVVDRVNRFSNEAEKIRKTYRNEEWKSHYQNVTTISTYLWSEYPDKYYIYRYQVCKDVASFLESDFKVKKGAKAEVLLEFNAFYDEIASYLMNDPATIDLISSALTPECYPDPEFRTLTIDVCYYIYKIYLKRPPEIFYWPSQEDYPLTITKEQWRKFIEEVEFPYHKGCMKMLKGLLELGGEASCKKLSSVYGANPTKYIGSAVNTGKRAKKYFNLPPCMDGDVERFFAIPYLGRKVVEEGNIYYSYKLRPELQEALEEIDLSSINPYENDDEEVSHYWWLNASPKIWSFSDVAVGAKQSYTLYNDNGNKRRIFQNFLDAKAGDMVIGYESTPVKQVVAIAKISQEQDGEKLWFEKVEGLASPIDYQVLKDCAELENMEYFSQPQGSLFRLTKDEFNFVMDLIREENPAPLDSEDHVKYTREDFLREVYMTEAQYDSLVSLLEHKSNLILQGAPGVGKTFAAKRLAYAIMGEKDESRIEFVQFHQNYSYEDFMMGYKPSGDGFDLKYGIFYRFCMQAANHPEKKYFFIIDEINRGNMSKIFGELLMLIEKDYRGEKATLAYNSMQFAVPKNIYIIGMMNTADRSLAMIDYALRRRFSFFTMTPGFTTEGFKEYQNGLNSTVFNRLVAEVRDLNQVITKDKSLGAGFCIGHSYFCDHKAGENDSWIKEIVDYDIIPMLQEYWFDDADKVKDWSDRLQGVFHG